MHDTSIGIDRGRYPFRGQLIFDRATHHAEQHIKKWSIGMSDSRYEKPCLYTWIEVRAPEHHSPLRPGYRLDRPHPSRLGGPLHPAEILFHQAHHRVEAHATYEDDRSVVRHEVGLVEFTLGVPCVPQKIRRIAFRPEHGMYGTDGRVHLFVIRRRGPVQIAVTLLDQNHPLHIELAEDAVAHAISLDSEEQRHPRPWEIDVKLHVLLFGASGQPRSTIGLIPPHHSPIVSVLSDGAVERRDCRTETVDSRGARGMRVIVEYTTLPQRVASPIQLLDERRLGRRHDRMETCFCLPIGGAQRMSPFEHQVLEKMCGSQLSGRLVEGTHVGEDLRRHAAISGAFDNKQPQSIGVDMFADE